MLELKAAKDELKERLLRRLPKAGHFSTPVKGVGIHRKDHPSVPGQCFSIPRMSKIVQGCKRSVVGGKEYLFGETIC